MGRSEERFEDRSEQSTARGQRRAARRTFTLSILSLFISLNQACKRASAASSSMQPCSRPYFLGPGLTTHLSSLSHTSSPSTSSPVQQRIVLHSTATMMGLWRHVFLVLFAAVHPEQRVNAFSPRTGLTQPRASTATCTPATASDDVLDTCTTTPTNSRHLDIVLFGIGDLRTTDHLGLTRALQSEGHAILPLFLLDTDCLPRIPGGASHVLDTELMLSAALDGLAAKLREETGLELHVYSEGKNFGDSLREVLVAAADAAPLQEITIHTCNLGDADNLMGYAPYAYLQDMDALDLDGADAAAPATNGISVNIQTWDCNLRSEPWQQIEELPSQFPSYRDKYQLQSREASPPEAAPIMSSHDPSKQLSIPALQTIPDSRDILTILCRSLDLDLHCVETRQIIENERSTGLYATHWGGLDCSSISEQSVLSGLEAYAACNEDDDAFLQSDWWKSLKCVRNGRSLEHAALSWMMRGDGDDSFAPIQTSNLIQGEFVVRYLAAPLLFGTVSPRTVYQMASPEGGVLDFVPFLRKASVLRNVADHREWHRLFAAANIRRKSAACQNRELGETKASYWRWHGFLCRYVEGTIAESGAASKKEGIVLCHGFGASGSQWTKAISALSKCWQPALGDVVSSTVAFAPDLLGFGESEKPQLSYTQYLWQSYVSSFVKEICIREKKIEEFVVGGNSIGGYTSMSVAADDCVPIEDAINGVNAISSSGAPGTNRCNGLILMNSAGKILSRDEVEKTSDLDALVTVGQETAGDDLPKCSPPPTLVARIGATGLLAYLRPRIRSICTRLYPTNPAAVDDVLVENILRDSLDPGAINVMVSGSKLPPPRTANELLAADFGSARSLEKNGQIPEGQSIIAAAEGMWDGPVLVAQGILDPLNDAKTRAKLLGSLRDGITIQPINAGHCVHDELEDDVANAIVQWINDQEKGAMLGIESSSILIS